MLINTIVSDLDDTLLRSDLTIGEYTINILKDIHKKGINRILASGRTYKSMKKYVDLLEIQGPIVSDNGATITDSTSGKVLLEKKLTAQQVRICLSLAKEHGVYAQVYDDEYFYFSIKGTGCDEKYSKLTDLPGQYIKNIETAWDESSTKVVFIVEPRLVEDFSKIVKEKYDSWLNLTTSKPYLVELSAKAASKGKALEWLESKAYLSKDTTMVFGDSLNDVSMLSYAKYPVAVANARQEVKDIAWKIVASNDEEGVGKTIEKLICEGEMHFDKY